VAIINPVLSESASVYDKFNISVWSLLAGGDVGASLQMQLSGDRSIQVSGACTIEGSNDGVTFFTLNDAVAGAPLVFAGAGLKQIFESTRFIRPTGVVGAVEVTLLAKRQF
jgi:hypothetical protein